MYMVESEMCRAWFQRLMMITSTQLANTRSSDVSQNTVRNRQLLIKYCGFVHGGKHEGRERIRGFRVMHSNRKGESYCGLR